MNRLVSSASETLAGLGYKIQRMELFYTKSLQNKVRRPTIVCEQQKHPQEIRAGHG